MDDPKLEIIKPEKRIPLDKRPWPLGNEEADIDPIIALRKTGKITRLEPR